MLVPGASSRRYSILHIEMISTKLGSFNDKAILNWQERTTLYPESHSLKAKNFRYLRKSWKHHDVNNYGYRKEVNDIKQINVHDQLGAFRRCSIEDMFRLEVRS